MIKTIRRFRALALPLLIAASLSACATGRSVVDIAPLMAPATNGTAFAKITEVNDLRSFEASPKDAGTPSLRDSSQIGDKAITSRAIARKRNGYGMALGDIVLPEGKTVAGLVRAAAQRALQNKGYTVVDDTSPQYPAALPVGVDVIDFWSWFSPGFATATLRFKSTVRLKSDPIVGPDAPLVESHLSDETMAAFESTWADMIKRGVDDLSLRIEERIKPAGTSH